MSADPPEKDLDPMSGLARSLKLHRQLWQDFVACNGRNPTMKENADLARRAGLEGDDEDMPTVLPAAEVKDLLHGKIRKPPN